MFEIDCEDKQEARIHFEKDYRLSGESSNTFKKWLKGINFSDYEAIGLDLRNVEFIDSMGIASIIWLKRDLDKRKVNLRIINCSDNILKILKMLKLDSFIDINS
jgi:anti-anti-sigma factor